MEGAPDRRGEVDPDGARARAANPEYGHANWFLNPGRKVLPAAPEASVTFRGAGQNIVYVDWDNDLVMRRALGSVLSPALNEFHRQGARGESG
jgi:hypothetical protein